MTLPRTANPRREATPPPGTGAPPQPPPKRRAMTEQCRALCPCTLGCSPSTNPSHLHQIRSHPPAAHPPRRRARPQGASPPPPTWPLRAREPRCPVFGRGQARTRARAAAGRRQRHPRGGARGETRGPPRRTRGPNVTAGGAGGGGCHGGRGNIEWWREGDDDDTVRRCGPALLPSDDGAWGAVNFLASTSSGTVIPATEQFVARAVQILNRVAQQS
jgi:hypothetical protein